MNISFELEEGDFIKLNNRKWQVKHINPDTITLGSVSLDERQTYEKDSFEELVLFSEEVHYISQSAMLNTTKRF